MKNQRIGNAGYWILALMISIGSLTGCRSLKEPEYRSISHFAVSQPGLRESTVRVDIEYFNPNNFDVKLKDAFCDIYLEDNYLGRFATDTVINVPKNALFRIPLKGKVNVQTLLRNAMGGLSSREVTVKAEGRTRIGRNGIYISYPVNYVGKHSISDFLDLLN